MPDGIPKHSSAQTPRSTGIFYLNDLKFHLPNRSKQDNRQDTDEIFHPYKPTSLSRRNAGRDAGTTYFKMNRDIPPR